ncbi:MAG: hypothetical protein APR63_09745 [Desulfuromonas sp. SDB]|nr:MAG: hypothetical protein APR63_09745 [Desulfuromonas sp. SDB]
MERGFKWLAEILDDVVIINSKYSIKFLGRNIHKYLFNEKKINFTNVLKNFSESDATELKTALKNSLDRKQAQQVKLKKKRKPIYIIANRQQQPYFLGSINKKISQAERIHHDLDERVKELECLYRISYELDTNDLDQALENSVNHLVQAFQYPEITSAHININQKIFTNQSNFNNPGLVCLARDITVNDVKIGEVKICYHRKEKFITEEKKLLNEITSLISKTIEKRDLRIELGQYLGKLEELVKIKTNQLEESRKRYQDLFHNAPDSITISDTKGQIIKANEVFKKLVKYPDGDDLNYVKHKLIKKATKTWHEIVHELHQKKYLKGFELTVVDKNGTLYPVIGSFRLFNSPQGEQIEAIFKDISTKKEQENNLIAQKNKLEKIVKERTKDLEHQKHLLLMKNKALIRLTGECYRSRKNLETLFSAITDPIIVVDHELNIVKSNKEYINSGEKCYKKIFNIDTICENCPVITSFQTKTSVTLERKIDKNYYMLQAYPIINKQGEVENVLEVCNDLTREKQMEMQLIQTDKLASLGKIVSGVAHEINNPNTFIKGNINILKESLKDMLPILDQIYCSNQDLKIARLDYPVFKENILVLIEDMQEGTTRIKKIVDDLRNFARRDEGLLTESVNVNQVIENSIRLVEKQIRRNSELKIKLNPILPKIKGNTQRLEQVMVNLLINAGQAIEDKAGEVSVESRWDQNNGKIIIYVKDNGSGMDQETIQHIFDPFFTTKKNRSGTGLGLSIVYGIIEEHLGKIEVFSMPGQGSTFKISLPTIS